MCAGEHVHVFIRVCVCGVCACICVWVLLIIPRDTVSLLPSPQDQLNQLPTGINPRESPGLFIGASRCLQGSRGKVSARIKLLYREQ